MVVVRAVVVVGVVVVVAVAVGVVAIGVAVAVAVDVGVAVAVGVVVTADAWAGTTPRRWQREAYDATVAAMRGGERRPLIHACTGAGKSRLVGALASRCRGTVLVTTPTQTLVEQLASTLRQHCGVEAVGRAYQRAWEVDRRVVVACLPSLEAVLQSRSTWACWIADEAHRLEGDDARRVRDGVEARVAVGVTATPYRADDRGLELWDRLVYSYTSHQAVQDGVLVPWRVVRSPVARDVEELTAEWMHDADGPGVVNAATIDDAEATAERLGVLAIHGRHSPEEQARRLALLERGQIPALVHCQLLVEGIDLPWLRWLILRRRSASRVRLVQEVGRVLRAAPGKREAVIYDPHDALGDVGLTHGAQLEDLQRIRPVSASVSEPLEIPPIPGLEVLRTLPRSAAVTLLEGWATDAVAALRAAGAVRPPPVNPDGPWRRRPATDAQRTLAARAASQAQHLTPEHATAVQLLLSAERLRAGTASDCLSILLSARSGVALPAVG